MRQSEFAPFAVIEGGIYNGWVIGQPEEPIFIEFGGITKWNLRLCRKAGEQGCHEYSQREYSVFHFGWLF